jgi:hypothetical protein
MNKLELLEQLKKLDEVALLELLELTSEDIIDAFYDKVYDNIDRMYQYIGEQEEL